jgi:hypothetical protein
MQSAFEQFQENMSRVEALMGIYKSINTQTTGIVDSSDILRAALVFSVSALDKFIHDVTRIGMLETFQGKRKATDAFLRFQLSMRLLTFSQTASEGEKLSFLDEEIRERHSWQSFQRPDKIADALRLVTDIKLWEEVTKVMQTDVKALKTQLTLIIDRRDKIAHEADIVPHSERLPDRRWNIDDMITQNTVDFIRKLVESIYKILTS